jgi:hypothetical protein
MITKVAFGNTTFDLRRGARKYILKLSKESSGCWFAVFLQSFSVVLFPNKVSVNLAVVFWGASGLVVLIGLACYAFVFPRLEVVKNYRLRAAQQGSLTVNDDLYAAGVGGKVILKSFSRGITFG